MSRQLQHNPMTVMSLRTTLGKEAGKALRVRFKGLSALCRTGGVYAERSFYFIFKYEI